MSWNPKLTNLRDELANIYDTRGKAICVVENAGLNLSFIDLSGSPIEMWYQILKEANLRDKVQAIVDVVVRDYPNLEERLKLAIKGKLAHEPKAGPTTSKKVETEPCVGLAIDRLRLFRERIGGRYIIYGTVGLNNGCTAFGEGIDLQLTLKNCSSVDVIIPVVNVLVEDHDEHPIQIYEYSALESSGVHIELPGSTLSEPIELTELEGPGSTIPITRRRLLLAAAGKCESQHTLNFAVIARAPGLWRFRVQVAFVDSKESQKAQVTQSETFYVVKR